MKAITKKGTGRAATVTPKVQLHVVLTRRTGDTERYLLAEGESQEWANEMRKRIQRIRIKAERLSTRIEKVRKLRRRVKAA